MTEKHTKQSIQERLKIPYALYHAIVSILIGVGIGLVIIGAVGYATRDSRPTQYALLLIRNATGIDLLSDNPQSN